MLFAADFEGELQARDSARAGIPPVSLKDALPLASQSQLFAGPKQQRLYTWDVPDVRAKSDQNTSSPILWVRVQGIGADRYLQLAEVEVLGTPLAKS